MSSFKRALSSLSIKKLKRPVVTTKADKEPEIIYYMVSFSIDLTIKGQILITSIPVLINALTLAWILELFGNDTSWSECIGYLWKSLRDNIMETLTLQLNEGNMCHMMTVINHLGFSDGSCIDSKTPLKKNTDSRSWELFHPNHHLIVITSRFSITLQTFTHEKIHALRDNGSHKLDILTDKEHNLLKYMGVNKLKPQYTHEKCFEEFMRIKDPGTLELKPIPTMKMLQQPHMKNYLMNGKINLSWMFTNKT